METNREHMRLEMESLSRNEEFARVVTAVFMSRLDPTLEEVDDVKTAVSEAVTNAVIHGYRGGRGTIYLDLTADLEERVLTVAVKDRGVGIADVKQAMEPMFTTDPEGERSGMGFSFMEAFMDQVEVESQPNHGTLVTMKKSIGR
ncbi:anti-sigma F factor [Enterocloster clostridioformis]|uniref:anti-sigma F factor n=1 Tax=Enterocloster clostridioformis TaxID=1531 RepID=UPI00080C9B40|nr:anti-sigma F factor [Enterocloster clostridioformis]ANU50745.1 anti-sigma F factor [Lachnoclostridium sp. YL32]NDO28383.1 anti-sigma F factor [Enterocloster clostridioformis]OXE71430.1 anti-sigma F factor [Enterocloster clostridioformis]QQR00976.1 anti-sigma F factor [Enterocloster clostridioformis]